MVDDGVVAGVVRAPFIDVVTETRGGTEFQCADAQDACSAAAIEDALAMKIQIQEGGANHAGGFVGSRAEGQVGINFDEERLDGGTVENNRAGGGQMTAVMDDDTLFTIHFSTFHFDGFEAFLLPLLVPVAVFGFAYIIINTDRLEGETFEHTIQKGAVEERLLDIGLEASGGFFETFATGLAKEGGKDVLGILQTGRQGECYFVVFHKAGV